MRRKKLRKKKRTRTRATVPENYRTDMSMPREEYLWLRKWKSGPNNRSGIPAGLESMSADPDATIAWLHAHCKFLKTSCAIPIQRYDEHGGGARDAEGSDEG